MKIRRGDELSLSILYQTACAENNCEPILLTDELEEANRSVTESLKSIGVDLKIEKEQSKTKIDLNGVWSYTLYIPIELKMSNSLDSSDLNQNTLKSFKVQREITFIPSFR
jgi:hypothetical protein